MTQRTPQKTRHPKAPRVKVFITAAHISRGVIRNSKYCMVAEAIKDTLPTATNCEADVATCRFTLMAKKERYWYRTPVAAQVAIAEYDAGILPEPFSILLTHGHVTKAGAPKRVRALHAKKRAEKARQRTGGVALVGSHRQGTKPRQIGGRIPPRLKVNRLFGVFASSQAHKERMAAVAKAHAERERVEASER